MIQSQRVYARVAGRVGELKRRLQAVAGDANVQADPLLAVAVPASLRILIRALEAEMQEFQTGAAGRENARGGSGSAHRIPRRT